MKLIEIIIIVIIMMTIKNNEKKNKLQTITGRETGPNHETNRSLALPLRKCATRENYAIITSSFN